MFALSLRFLTMVTEHHEQLRKCFSLPTIWLLQAPIHFTVCVSEWWTWAAERFKAIKKKVVWWPFCLAYRPSYHSFLSSLCIFTVSCLLLPTLSINISLFVLPRINSLHLLVLKPKELTLVSQIFATIFVVEMALQHPSSSTRDFPLPYVGPPASIQTHLTPSKTDNNQNNVSS